MRCKNWLTPLLGKKGLVGTLILALIASVAMLTAGCFSSSSSEGPPTSYMRSQVGTSNELSPQAPGEAKNLRKVGNQWLCEVNGRTMVYNHASSCWEPQQK
jgi:hypothetical protein